MDMDEPAQFSVSWPSSAAARSRNLIFSHLEEHDVSKT